MKLLYKNLIIKITCYLLFKSIKELNTYYIEFIPALNGLIEIKMGAVRANRARFIVPAIASQSIQSVWDRQYRIIGPIARDRSNRDPA